MPTGSPSTAPLGPPLIGALLRMPGDVVRRRMLAALQERGFTDIVPAHLPLMRWPGPQGQRPSDIAAQVDMTKQAVNYLLGQLEGLGYVERRPNADDQRSRRVYLTPRGREAGQTMREAVSDLEAEWSARLGRDDFEQLRTLLLRLNEGLVDSTPSGSVPEVL